MDQTEKALAFKALHVRGTPLVLWNVWDAGSAKAVAETGVPAVATGSWSVAAAQGFADGEALPLEDALRTARQIVAGAELPVSVDFEGGYAVSPEKVQQNVSALIATGAIGLNFEDRVVGGEGLHTIADQTARIAAIRKAGQSADVPVFINARTDVFFSGSSAPTEELLAETLRRAEAYAEAGADGLFVPGVKDLDLIAQIAEGQPMPLNFMRMSDEIRISDLAAAGVARVSHGPKPYLDTMKSLASNIAS